MNGTDTAAAITYTVFPAAPLASKAGPGGMNLVGCLRATATAASASLTREDSAPPELDSLELPLEPPPELPHPAMTPASAAVSTTPSIPFQGKVRPTMVTIGWSFLAFMVRSIPVTRNLWQSLPDGEARISRRSEPVRRQGPKRRRRRPIRSIRTGQAAAVP